MTGIDRIILNKIKINNFEKLDKKSVLTTSKTSEYFEYRDEMCELKQSYHLDTNGTDYFVSSLDFNPNRILRGNNISNSTTKELIEALEIIVSILKSKGIDIDVSEACIKYLEVNKNIELGFNTLQEVFLAIGRSNFKKSFGHLSFTEEDIPFLIKKDRSIYINLREVPYTPERPEESVVLIAYDKTFEAMSKYGLNVARDLTRVELKIGRDYYRQELQKRNIDNTLMNLIKNYEIVDDLFNTNVKKYFFDNTMKYIEETLKSNLKKDFLDFKRTEAIKRKKRVEYTASGREVPDHLKEIRGVYNYLLSSSWIFDVSLLAEVIEKNIRIEHRNRDLKRVRSKYSNIDNLKRLHEFSKKLLNIFITTNTN